MNRRVVFARSRDGTRVACSVEGRGFPFIQLNIPFAANCLLPPEGSSLAFQERLSASRSLVMADLRGCGAADWHPASHKFDDYLDDILAIMKALDIPQADLSGAATRASVAVRFAAHYPERVRRLVLQAPTLGPNAASALVTVAPAGIAMLTDDWDLYVETMASRLFGGEADVRLNKQRILASVDQKSLLAAFQAALEVDVTQDAASLQHPTLVWDFADNALVVRGETERFALASPLVQLRYLPHRPRLEWLDDFAEAIEEFDASFSPTARGPRPSYALSDREAEVLALLAAGCSNRQIADRLTISQPTVATHLRHILEKTGTANRAEAAAWAVRNGFA